MRCEELCKHEQTKCKCCCKHNATINLFYKIRLSRNNEIYLNIEDKSKSFLRQFAAFIVSIFGISPALSARKTDGTSVTIPLLGTTSASVCHKFGSFFILVSNNSNDRFLTFDDFNITHISSTRLSGYPQSSYSLFSDRMEMTISDAHLYTGSDTNIYATGLRIEVTTWVGATINSNFLIAKDIFDPPLSLLSNSRVDVSYKIVISL